MPFHYNYNRNTSVAPFNDRMQMDVMQMLQGCNTDLFENLLNASNSVGNILDFGQTPAVMNSADSLASNLSTLKQKLEHSLNVPALQNAKTTSVSEEAPRKRNKPDNESSAENPLFQSPKKDEDFKSKMSEGLLKISDFQNDDKSKSSDEEVDKSLPGTPKSDAKSIASIDIASEQASVTDAVDVTANEHLMKELQELKSKILKLEVEKNLETQKKDEEMNELKRQIEEGNKNIEDLKTKIERMENEMKTLKIPSMEDFDNLRKKVEHLEQGNESKEDQNDEKDDLKAEPKEKEDNEKNLSDIDMCILNLSQTINAYFKKLAGRLMSGQKEKEEELMMERLRSLEPVQAVIYEKLRWILSMGSKPNNEGALRSAAKVSKHFPFLLAFLGFNYHDLIMMSIGMDGEISQAEGAMRLAKWFNNILTEKTEDNKRIWPSSVSTNMLASILTERFSSTAKETKGLKVSDSMSNKQSFNPMVPPPSRQEKEISIVGEFSQNNKREHPSNLDASHYGTSACQAFPSLMDMRTLGSTQKPGNRAIDKSFKGHLPGNKDGLGNKTNRF